LGGTGVSNYGFMLVRKALLLEPYLQSSKLAFLIRIFTCLIAVIKLSIVAVL
jgi:hypothetical protein